MGRQRSLRSKAAHLVSDLTTVLLNPISDKPTSKPQTPRPVSLSLSLPLFLSLSASIFVGFSFLGRFRWWVDPAVDDEEIVGSSLLSANFSQTAHSGFYL